MKRPIRNAWRKWAGDYFKGWLRGWAIKSAFEAGWRMAKGEKIRPVKQGQEVMSVAEAKAEKKRRDAEHAVWCAKHNWPV